MATKYIRAWFVDKMRRIGIVEQATNASTRDGWTTNWRSITEAKDIRIYAISKDADLTINNTNLTFSNIPSQFHEGLVNKAIATGYKDPRHFEIQAAQYFDNEYEKTIRRGKKFSKSNYQTTGIIKGQDY